MEWQIITGIGTARKVSIALAKEVEIKYNNDRLVSTLNLGDSRRIGNETGYTCTLRFTESMRPKNLTAKNVPTYTYTWKNYEETEASMGRPTDNRTLSRLLQANVTHRHYIYSQITTSFNLFQSVTEDVAQFLC